MKSVIVTGADGFIGNNVVEKLLKEGYYVYAIGVNENNLINKDSKNVKFLKLYFEDYGKIAELINTKIDYFFHFAWCGVFGTAFKNYELQLDNAKYACIAIEEAIKLGAKKFILASTVNTLEARYYMEQDSIEPRYTNIYAMAKLSAEMMCKTIAYQNKIDYNCGIIGMVYGENNKSMMVPNVVIKNLLENKESNLIAENTPYDLVYVKDVADAFFKIAIKGINQKSYYIGHRQLSTFGELFNKIKNILNPNGILNFGVFPDTSKIDYSKIRLDDAYKDLGFEPSYDFAETIISTANYLKIGE